jgi:hypothetical protein
VVILRVFREVELTNELEKFTSGFENKFDKDDIENFVTRIEFMKWFTEKCEVRLFPNENNIEALKGFKNYEFIFSNVYYILEGLEN